MTLQNFGFFFFPKTFPGQENNHLKIAGLFQVFHDRRSPAYRHHTNDLGWMKGAGPVTDLFVLQGLLPPPPAPQGLPLRPAVHQRVQRLAEHQVAVMETPHAWEQITVNAKLSNTSVFIYLWIWLRPSRSTQRWLDQCLDTVRTLLIPKWTKCSATKTRGDIYIFFRGHFSQ